MQLRLIWQHLEYREGQQPLDEIYTSNKSKRAE